MTAGRGPCQVDSMREPEMTIPPIEFLTAANARRLSDPSVMGLAAYRHPYTDDVGAATVAQALARMPEHWKATPTCVAFSRLYAIDQAELLRIGDVVEGHRIEDRRDPSRPADVAAHASGCGGAVALRVQQLQTRRLAAYIGADFTADVYQALADDLRTESAVVARRQSEMAEKQSRGRADAPVWRLSGERVWQTPPTARIDPATREANINVNARFDQRERGPGIVHVRGIELRPVATVGYDDPTGDDVAADWRRS